VALENPELDPVTDELVTVAEAAKATNVSERAIRRYLSRPENTAQLRQVTRRTRTGTRQATVFPKSLLLSFLPHEDDDDEANLGSDITTTDLPSWLFTLANPLFSDIP